MRILALDIETTGLDQQKGHKIIELAFLTYDSNTKELLDTWVQRFDPNRPIDAGAQAVHGISYSDLVGSPTWEDLAPEISRRMSEADLLVAHNMNFDGPFIGLELARVSANIPDVDSFCTMENARWSCADGKLPKLGELCFSLGVRYDTSKAHGAEYDVEVMMACFFKAVERGFYKLPVKLES